MSTTFIVYFAIFCIRYVLKNMDYNTDYIEYIELYAIDIIMYKLLRLRIQIFTTCIRIHLSKYSRTCMFH